MEDKSHKPGLGSYLLVLLLLLEAVLELVLLPFRLAAFLIRKKKVTGEIQSLLENQHTKEGT